MADKMNRRSLLNMIASLPFLGLLWKEKRVSDELRSMADEALEDYSADRCEPFPVTDTSLTSMTFSYTCYAVDANGNTVEWRSPDV